MQYTGYSLAQAVSLDAIVAGLTGATGVEGVILSNQADFNTKNTAIGVKNTSQDNALSALETKAAGLEAGATGLEERNTALDAALVVVQSREDALLAGLTGAAGLEARAVGFNTNITAINANLGGNIQEQINTKVADSIFQSLKTEFETDFAAFQAELNQKVVTATQEVLDARQDSDDAALEKKFCSIEEFAQTFLQTYTVLKPDNTPYKFDGKIQKVDKAPPIFSIVEKKQNGANWDLKVKLTDYGYNVMSGNLIVKDGTDAVVNTLTKADFDATTKLYALTLANSNSAGTLINGPYTFEYQASTSTAVYSLVLDSTVLSDIPLPLGVLGEVAWGKWIGGTGNDIGYGISAASDAVYVIGESETALTGNFPAGFLTAMGTKPGAATTDVFIIKYDLDGVALWGKWIGGAGSDSGFNIAAASDAVYITGSSDSLTISGVSGNNPGNSGSAYIIKLSSSNGSTVWGNWIGGNVGSTFGRGISVTSDMVYVSGDSNCSFITGIGFKTESTRYGFVMKYDSNGTIQWGKWIGADGGPTFSNSIGANATDVYITGHSSADISGFINTRVDSSDIFVAKLSATNGNITWGKYIGGLYVDQSYGISVTSDSLYIAGNTKSVITGITDTKPGAVNNMDGIVVKLSLVDGSIIWGKWIGGIYNDECNSISATDNGVYVTGYSESSTVNGITGTKPGSAEAAFIVKYSTSGSVVFGKWIGGSVSTTGRSISANSTAVFMTGNSNGLSVNEISGTKPGPLYNNDAFILKYV